MPKALKKYVTNIDVGNELLFFKLLCLSLLLQKKKVLKLRFGDKKTSNPD